MAYRRVGTSYRNLAGSTGGVIDELGSGLLSTDTSGSRAQTFGPQLAQQLTFGIPNSDFALLPQDPDYPIAADNELPFFSYLEGPDFYLEVDDPPEPVHLSAHVRVATEVGGEWPTASGYLLELTAEAGAQEGEAIAFERWVQLPTNFARTMERRPKIHVYTESQGVSAEDVNFFYQADYFDVTQQTNLFSRTRNNQLSNIDPFANAAGVPGYEIDILGGANFTTPPTAAYWLRIRFGLAILANTTSTETIYVTGLRISNTVDDIRVIDDTPTPTANSYGDLIVSESRLILLLQPGTRLGYVVDNNSASVQIDGRVGERSLVNDEPVFKVGAAPFAATYDGPATILDYDPLIPGELQETNLELNDAKLRGVEGFPDADANVIVPPAGTYLINLRVTVEPTDGIDAGTLGARLRLDGSVIGENYMEYREPDSALGGLPRLDLQISLVRPLDGTQELSVTGYRFGTDQDWEATVAELTLIHLGRSW